MKGIMYVFMAITAGTLALESPQIKVDAYTESGTKSDSVYGKEIVENYEFSMPEIVIVNKTAEKNIRDFAEKEKTAYTQYSQALYWIADEAYRDFLINTEKKDTAKWIPFEYETEYQPERIDDTYISMRKYTNVYMGGPHGDIRITGIVLDAKTGEKMSLTDFLGGQEKSLLAQYIIEQLAAEERNEKAAGGKGYLFDDYKETVESIVNDAPNFFLREDKLVFVFNTYEIAPYVYGDIWVEVPLGILPGLKEAVLDKEAAYSRKEALLYPVKANHYLSLIPAGETKSVDLNGDGVTEEILFPEKGVDGCYITLMINGKKNQFNIDENIIETYIGLSDIDAGDGKYELAVYAFGPSSDETTTFFDFDGEKLQEIGRIEGLANSRKSDSRYDLHTEYRFQWNSTNGESFFYKTAPAASLMGNGIIRSQKRIDIADTIWTEGEWQLDKESGQLTEVIKDYYELYNPWCNRREENPYTLEKDIFLYKEENKEAGGFTISKEDGRILRFIKTDGKETGIYAEVLTAGEVKRGWIAKEDIASIANLWKVD